MAADSPHWDGGYVQLNWRQLQDAPQDSCNGVHLTTQAWTVLAQAVKIALGVFPDYGREAVLHYLAVEIGQWNKSFRVL